MGFIQTALSDLIRTSPKNTWLFYFINIHIGYIPISQEDCYM
jgi:hypothetical protein